MDKDDSMDVDGGGNGPLANYMEEASKLDSLSTSLVNCRADGCEVQTDRQSGYCKQHEDAFKTSAETRVLKCEECPDAVKEICEFKDKTSGMCHFEVTLSSDDFSQKETMAAEFRKLLNSARIIIGRIERAIGSDLKDATNAFLLKELRQQRDSFVQLQTTYNKFMGWDRDGKGKTDKLERMKVLQKVMGGSAISITTKDGEIADTPHLKTIKVDGLIVGEENGKPLPSDEQGGASDEEVSPEVIDEEALNDHEIPDDLQALETLEADAKREPQIANSPEEQEDINIHTYDHGNVSDTIKRRIGRR